MDYQRYSVISFLLKGVGSMLYVGIDVAKHKHDCFITNSDGEHLKDSFVIENSRKGFDDLISSIKSFEPNPSLDNVKVGLEATGHYSNNIINFLTTENLNPIVLNPLHTNLYRKGRSLRKTKTDKSDARFITMMIMMEDFEPYSPSSYHISELKALTRHRFRLVQMRSKLLVSYTRILDIVFPEISELVWSKSQKSMLKLFLELPGAEAIQNCHLTKLTNILISNTKGKYRKEKAIEIKKLAKISIGSSSPAIAFELQQTIQMILFIRKQIEDLDKQLKVIVDEIGSPVMTIPGISHVLASFIICEINDIGRFSSPDKLQAFAGLEPSTYESGKFESTHAQMVKRGSKYLRWAILQAARLVCMRDASFREYKDKKISEGKHYFVALSHVAKKLIRVIYHLMNSGQAFTPQR